MLQFKTLFNLWLNNPKSTEYPISPQIPNAQPQTPNQSNQIQNWHWNHGGHHLILPSHWKFQNGPPHNAQSTIENPHVPLKWGVGTPHMRSEVPHMRGGSPHMRSTWPSYEGYLTLIWGLPNPHMRDSFCSKNKLCLIWQGSRCLRGKILAYSDSNNDARFLRTKKRSKTQFLWKRWPSYEG